MAEWFTSFVRCGFNVIFTGAVRTAKTTMLETWQSYEDGRLEGLMIETTPEIPLHEILPDAPIMQLQVTEDKLSEVVAPVLRSDADYFIMAEARTGMDLWLAITIASKGSRRSKTTYHTSNPKDICYNVASEICNVVGGNIDYTQSKVSSALDYVIHMVQLTDKSQKRVESIHEIRCDEETHKPVAVEICRYDKKTDSWKFRNFISQDHIEKAKKEDEDAFYEFEEGLRNLASEYPIDKKEEPTLGKLLGKEVAV
jgi:pilus assembly protein CpaF